MNKGKKVVVTGMGIVCSLGDQLETFWNNCLEGKVAVQDIPEQWFHPYLVSMSMPNAPAGQIAISYGLQGPNNTICASCASGTMAIGWAYEALRDGTVDFAFNTVHK